ncbi:tetratricopeptide repeat protein [Pseudomonas sp. BGr12]|uniref:Methyltransferase domain-containing protein n=1 Tax=Pseudomonas nitroreducens TaxID=46680 RepID=A0A5R9A0Y0_PSENT|nr:MULTISPECIES: methyltransferase domain-containing protein [Pseudomonas]MBD9500028.1 methyltransferase domain-containing protein [Pseudomonas sp. PDM17]MBD9575278.1 methyltransferase domain-containing protein [Pseudomonas sp. PDM23]MBD9669780.1 methyltransferase domain-containing protein [Pseudomonas sp. PDM21]MDL2427921.1 methyltransferase domain-containing protein [Pseudomonas sp. BJa5]TLP72272.1 methyltransferase domain-containing protein [Pseudomonas nitroreducens]
MSTSYEQRFAHAQQLQSSGQAAASIDAYRDLLQEYPDELPLRLTLAVALTEQRGSGDEAAEHLRLVLQAVPDNAAVNSLLGRLLVRDGKHDEAHEFLLQAIQLQPEDHDVRNTLATLALYQGHLEEAYHWLASLSTYQANADTADLLTQLELLQGKRAPQSTSLFGRARVFARSSRSADGPPGAKAIMEQNPSQRESLLNVTGWQTIEAGTLNLQALFNPLEMVRKIAPLFFESGSGIVYAPPYQQVPYIRMGYWYYQGYLQYQGRHAPVLIRRAAVPSQADVLEVFAEQNLRQQLQLEDGAEVLCYLRSPGSEAEDDTWRDCKLGVYEDFFSQSQVFGANKELYQGHEGWDLPGVRPTLLRMERYALEKWLSPTDRVLDIGCNIGCFGIEVAQQVDSYLGFDNNDSLIRIADRLAQHHKVENCEFRTCTYEDLRASEPGLFDVIFSFAVHVWIGKPMPDYVADLKNLLTPGGIVVIESNDMRMNDTRFFANMRHFYEQGFFLLYQGQLIDDGIHQRGFCVFKRLD